MRHTEQTARAICTLDLKGVGVRDDEIPPLVDRYWPVLAHEIRQGVAVGAWPFAAEEIATLSREYEALLKRR
ncbi:hypothetical protein QOZ99_002020 [Angulomicrobium amanitiforme]|uniref:Uncharacterized protein n=1 Tax=Ancylobacter amanitiformis TaxID=217069 RepID=A0ABU0LR21_9HYPH|nr:hypothetical protein [Ancylobacter amanitiformis]